MYLAYENRLLLGVNYYNSTYSHIGFLSFPFDAVHDVEVRMVA